jgi:hypothetical protein
VISVILDGHFYVIVKILVSYILHKDKGPLLSIVFLLFYQYSNCTFVRISVIFLLKYECVHMESCLHLVVSSLWL